MIGHGLLIMTMTLVAGLGLWMFLLGGFEVVPGYIIHFQVPGSADGWARAHRGTPMNSLMVLAIAAVLPKIPVPERVAVRCGWIVVWTGWANTVFYFASNFSTNRGLSFGANAFGAGDMAAIIALAPAYLFGLLSFVVTAYLGFKSLRSDGDN
ncbi:MAG: hypothetical protein EKK46_13410 [Rhodocyclaceae bacterium]|nr:MAG: hypothetical protein EKK46_13410 [Rhodocyclaceae bacterium]